MITKVIINKYIYLQFNKDLKNGLFSLEVRDLIEYWQTEVEELGYAEYKGSDLYSLLNDHPLKKDRQGQRSITLDQKGGRLLYVVNKNEVIVKVIKITSDHDYS